MAKPATTNHTAEKSWLNSVILLQIAINSVLRGGMNHRTREGDWGGGLVSSIRERDWQMALGNGTKEWDYWTRLKNETNEQENKTREQQTGLGNGIRKPLWREAQ